MTTPDTSNQPVWRYNAKLANDIELRWQESWEENGTFEAPNPTGSLTDPEKFERFGDKLFVLDMFPYPSGDGLHVGHPLGYIGTDIYCRFQRMEGRNVLYSMGFDAFGLPAEQHAVATGEHPAISTNAAIATYRRQLRRLGMSHDRRRSVSTIDPSYYRWTQWIFRTLFESWYDEEQDKARPIAELRAALESGSFEPDGVFATRPWARLSHIERETLINEHRLVYIAEAPVNWCPGLGTVVANEEVTADGRSDRGNFPVFKREMRQWMMRITRYADRLIDDLELLDWSDAIKTMQRNWIGRSEGAVVEFSTAAGPVPVFTTRPDTLFGASFLVLAPEHPLVEQLTVADHAESVASYRSQAGRRSDVDRQDESREKTGVPTGSYAVNPATNVSIPIWIADYVLTGYGTGAIMAVPCGDQRDFEFARKFSLPIPAIQLPPESWFNNHSIQATSDTSTWPEAFLGDAPYIQSANEFVNLNEVADVASAVTAMIDWLQESGHGEAAVNYKLRDWLFSRQRYWGEPFPIVFDGDGLPHSIPVDSLPVELPDTDSFSPRTFDPDDAETEPESPLDRLTDWINVELDIGDGLQMYRRDSNVMPQWAGSCWYEMRYLDPLNEDRFVDPEIERYWMGPQTDERSDHPGGVDLYVGGVEHAVLHLLYARFWHKVLYDLGHVSSREPYNRLFNQGYILADSFKDKRGVYVAAAEVVERDGAYFHEEEPVSRESGKMGKSLKNGVSPDDIYDQYGADTLRLYEMSMGPLEQSRPWETRDVVGMYRFLQRFWRNLVDEDTGIATVVDTEADQETRRALHRTIEGVTNDLHGLRFNTAIAKIIELNNVLTKGGSVPREIGEPLTLLLSPFAPHICEEIWSLLGHNQSLARESFPVAEADFLVDDEIEYPIQVNGKVRARVTVAANEDAATIERIALTQENVVRALNGVPPTRVIVVPGRMVNVVVAS